MSERGSFTTQYFYNENDYKIIRKALDQNDKYLCVSPPPKWGDYEMPIVSGKVGELSPNMEWWTIENALEGTITEDDVFVIVMCDCGGIYLIKKHPNGSVKAVLMSEDEEM